MGRLAEKKTHRTLLTIAVALSALLLLMTIAFNTIPLTTLNIGYSALLFISITGLLVTCYALGFILVVFTVLPVLFKMSQRKLAEKS